MRRKVLHFSDASGGYIFGGKLDGDGIDSFCMEVEAYPFASWLRKNFTRKKASVN